MAENRKFIIKDLGYCVLNNLKEFDNKSDMIGTLLDALRKVKDNALFTNFFSLFDEAARYYDTHGNFPDTETLMALTQRTMSFQVRNEKFSIQIYEDFLKACEYANLTANLSEVIATDEIDIDALNKAQKDIAQFANNSKQASLLDRDATIGLYRKRIDDFRGVYSGIPTIDTSLGMLGDKSLAVIVAPSGHGKTTISLSIAYNNAIKDGKCIDYLSFEDSKEKTMTKLISMESYMGDEDYEVSKLNASGYTSEEDIKGIEGCAARLWDKMEKSNGLINVVDQTVCPLTTLEGLEAKLEAMAEERGRGADIIIVDNVDNLGSLKSNTRNKMDKINDFIIDLDSFCKTYHNNQGCTIVLLSQTNRPTIAKLGKSNNDNQGESKEAPVDVTAVAQFNALYEKASFCVVMYANPAMQASGLAKIYPVKLRNHSVPPGAVLIDSQQRFSRIGGKLIESGYGLEDMLTSGEPDKTAFDENRSDAGLFNEDDEFEDFDNED